MTRLHKLVAVTMFVVGGYLVVVPFALSLFSRTVDAETLADRYRPLMSEQGLKEFSDNTAEVVAGGNELIAKALPKFGRDLNMTEASFDAYVAQNFPHVSAFQERAPKVFAYVTPAVAKVVAQKDNARDADTFPVDGIPVTVGPWALLGAGLALIAVGLLTLRAPRRAATVAALVVGGGLVLGPLVLQWPHKVEAAAEVSEVARIAFSPEVANATVDDTYKFDAAVVELRDGLLPAIGRQLGRSPAAMDASVAAEFPALSRFVHDWVATISDASHELSLSQLQLMDEFHNADATPYRALPWLFVAPGFVLVLAAGGALLWERRPLVRKVTFAVPGQ